MVASPDFQDFTQASSRLMLQVAESPVISVTPGPTNTNVTIPAWARSLSILVTNSSNIIFLQVRGATSQFLYLNAMPAYDSGIYYIPAFPTVDAQVTLTFYQVDNSSVSLYVIASDEPVAVSVFNPVSPTTNIIERMLYNFPQTAPVNAQTDFIVAPDTTTKALRLATDLVTNLDGARIRGNTTLIEYFNTLTSHSGLIDWPIPIDMTSDTAYTISIKTTLAGPAKIYVTAIDVPDFAGLVPLTTVMAPNDLSPEPKQVDKPNQLPALFNGTIVGSGSATLVAAVAGVQLRLHQLCIISTNTNAVVMELQDTTGNKYWRTGGVNGYSLVIPLFGQLAPVGAGIRLTNTNATISNGLYAVTLWYSVL